ncbi:hypothetical protein J4Q44_G00299620 [Coregonus suidteri]|uniref:Aminoglycoside phosphotransferase domain-containing protein n=1 Tax=Coregonus suidteri TaxID=861788 RepID=A0AAN8QCR3_9TELE
MLLPGAHKVDREYRVQKALFSAGFPVTQPAEERAALFVAAGEVLAHLHSLDLTTLDLEGYGRGPGYCKRQNWLMSNMSTNDNRMKWPSSMGIFEWTT